MTGTALSGQQESPSFEKSVVKKLFPTAERLDTFIHKQFGIAIVADESASSDLGLLCQNVLVVPREPLGPPRESPPIAPVELACTSIEEVVNRLISLDVRSNNTSGDQDRNILSLGYRLKRWQSELGMRCNNDIECFYVNTVHSLLRASSWRKLLRNIGDENFLVLLSLSMFQPAKRGCYIQISGVSVPRMIYGDKLKNSSLGRNNSASNIPFRDSRSDLSRSQSRDPTGMPGCIPIPRSRIFYHSKQAGRLCHRCSNRQDGAFAYCYCVEGNIGLPPSHELRKKATSAHGRGLVLVNHTTGLRHGDIEALDSLFDNLKLNYFTCNIRRALNIYCKLSCGVSAASGSENVPALDKTIEVSAINNHCGDEFSAQTRKKRKTRRGTRGGSHAKSRRISSETVDELIKDSELAKDIMSQCDIDALTVMNRDIQPRRRKRSLVSRTHRKDLKRKKSVEKVGIDIRNRKRILSNRSNGKGQKGTLRKSSLSCRGLITVGQRLWRRLLYSARLGSRFYSSSAEKRRSFSRVKYNEKDSIDISEFGTQPDDCDHILSASQERKHSEWSVDETTNVLLSTPTVPQHEGGLERNISDRRYMTQMSTQVSTVHGTGSAETQATLSSDKSTAVSAPNSGVSLNHHPIEGNSTNKIANRLSYGQVPSNGCEENFLGLACKRTRVSAFLRTVCLNIFTVDEVWGCRRNLNIFLAGLDRYISMGRRETTSLEEMSKGMAVSRIPWLKAFSQKNNESCNQEKDMSNCLSCSGLLNSFLYWIYTSVVNSLLRSCFYITEAESLGNEVLFYRHAIWRKLSGVGAKQICANFVQVFPDNNGLQPERAEIYTQVAAESTANKKGSKVENVYGAVQPNQLAFIPSIRLVPKKQSMRPITNLRSTFLRNKRGNLSTGGGNVVASAATSSAVVGGDVVTSLDPILSNRSHSSNAGGQLISNNSSNSPPPFLISNSTLYNILHVLRDFTIRKPELCGYGVLGSDGIYSRLKEFKKRLVSCRKKPDHRKPPNTNPKRYVDISDTPFYIATLDLDKCFDSMDTVKLFDLVQNLVLGHDNEGSEHECLNGCSESGENNNLVHKYNISHYIPSLEKKVVKSVKNVTKGNDFIPFFEAVETLTETHRNCIISDGVIYPSLSREKLLQLLKLHLFSHVVRMPISNRDKEFRRHGQDGYAYFTQIRGIPQGSVLSPILCNLYYGHAENKEFGSAKQRLLLGLDDGKSEIIRMMDDYMMISTDRDAVNHFLQQMHCAMKAYGGGVNPMKTRVNFEVDICLDGEIIRLPRLNESLNAKEEFVWCGWAVNARTLEIQPSFGKLIQRPLRSSVSVGNRNKGSLLRQTMKSFLRPKCHALALDPFINSRKTIIASISSIYAIAGMRGISYLRGSRITSGKGFGPLYICRCLSEAVLYGAKLIKMRSPEVLSPRLVSYKTGRGNCEEGDPCTNTHVRFRVNFKDQFIQLLYIGYKSILKVYEKKDRNHLVLLQFLRRKLRRLEAQLLSEVVVDIEEAMMINVADMLNAAKL